MADDMQRVWNTVESRYLEKLVRTERDLLPRFDGAESFLAHVNSLSELYSGKRSSKVLRRLRPMLEWLWSFNTCAQSFVQASPEAFALVWGSLSVILQVVP